jgi:hypothetical protein
VSEIDTSTGQTAAEAITEILAQSYRGPISHDEAVAGRLANMLENACVAARAAAFEQAAKVAEEYYAMNEYAGSYYRIASKRIAAAIRSLADKEPQT